MAPITSRCGVLCCFDKKNGPDHLGMWRTGLPPRQKWSRSPPVLLAGALVPPLKAMLRILALSWVWR